MFNGVKQNIRRFALLVATVFIANSIAAADIQFPPLTGRVVDQAGLLSPNTIQRLTLAGENHERKTTQQIVVVTVTSLQGLPIEDYGYQLGRHWGIGQKEKNNGALLIVAPNEREVRVEVGYGLEGVLTDAISKAIIEQKIIPAFRSGDYEAGVINGFEAMLGVSSGEESIEVAPVIVSPHSEGAPEPSFIHLMIAAIAIGQFLFFVFRSRLISTSLMAGAGAVIGWMVFQSLFAVFVLAILMAIFHLVFSFGGGRGGGFGTGRMGGGFGGGGFSGGGGSFGGGGASGRW